MTSNDIIILRLHNQQLIKQQFTTPADVVSHMGAIQAQEYAMAKWAIALRTKSALTDAVIDKAFNTGHILRTHILRPTWHFVSPNDIGWMLQLTAPRIHSANAHMYSKTGINTDFLNRCNTVMEKLLRDNNYCTRDEIKAEFIKNKIITEGQQMVYILMNAELEGLICSGPRKGKQFTYSLFEERVPKTKPVTREEALYKLSEIYFASRGPATVYDFAAWSGLTLTECRKGIALLDNKLILSTIDSVNYYYSTEMPNGLKLPDILLLPVYDEFALAYKDRSILSDTTIGKGLGYTNIILVKGLKAGIWKRTIQKNTVQIELHYDPAVPINQKALDLAVTGYTGFLEKKLA